MAYPRHLLVPPDTRGTYHCVSRCVRRAFLCGEDPVTGQSFAHRKAWLETRLLELGSLFAVAVHAYAVMSNHLHLVLEVDPNAPATWSDEDVATRWLALTSARTDVYLPDAVRIRHLLDNPQRLAVLRERLGSLSWFMRCLKEPIARQANKEDHCSGRFWEGRFKTQALLDDAAVLACMAYVDLNPLRAGLVERPEQGPNTSLRHRFRTQAPDQPLAPVATAIGAHTLQLPLSAYLELLEWTGRQLHQAVPSRAPPSAASVLTRIALRTDQWLTQVPATEHRYWRAIGTVHALGALAKAMGQRWLCGIGTARSLERLPPRVAPT